MALPVAPLGQLSNMNMPYSRPYYEKTSAVDKALAAFLVGLAGGVGGQAAENVMSRDFSQAAGGENAGFWSRLVSGPKMSRQQFEAETGRKAAEAAQGRDIASRERISEADRLAQQGMLERRLSDAANDRELQRELTNLGLSQRFQQAQYEADQQRRLAEFMAGNRLTEIGQEGNVRERLARIGGDEDRLTQKAKRDLEMEAFQQRIQMLRGATEGGGMSYNPDTGNLTTMPLTEAQRRAVQGVTRSDKSTMQSMVESPGGRILRFMTDPIGRTNRAYVEPNRTPVLPSVEEVMAPRDVQPVPAAIEAVPSAPAAAAGPLSLYDPTIDPILNAVADWMRTTKPINALDAARRAGNATGLIAR